ncbi:MAG TPA: hypothetical protein VHL58_06205 [Thermoanaerobaculia bacterium]|nr:hypothetical protein [Thermoanaerobaculia bacterium]
MRLEAGPALLLDGNEGVARIAYALNEVIAIYAITPARAALMN